MKMNKINMNKVMDLLAILKNKATELTEDRNHMLSYYDFGCAQDQFEFDCVTDELNETTTAIDKLYDIIYSDDTIIVDDELYYTNDDLDYDIFS